MKALIIAAIVGMASGSWAAPQPTAVANLAWDAPTNNPPGLVLSGYTLYWQQGKTMPASFQNSRFVGLTLTASVSNLVWNTDYVYAVTAKDTSGAESDYSVPLAYARTRFNAPGQAKPK